jgi:hypothetical protein
MTMSCVPSHARLAVALLLCTAPATLANAQSAATPPSVVSVVRSEGGGLRTLTYTWAASGKKDDVVTVRVNANGVGRSREPIHSAACTNGNAPTLQNDVLEWTCKLTAEKATLEVSVSAEAGNTSFGGATALKFKIGSGEWSVPAIDPEGIQATVDSRFFKPIFGGGFTTLENDAVDFTVKDDATLLVLNDSRLRVSALVGGLFRIGHIARWNRDVSAVISLQFTQGTTSAIDGVLFGGAFEINPYLHLTVGISRQKGKELSPGFRESASEIIAAHKDEDAYKRFATWSPTARQDSPLDGLSINDPATSKPFFPGPPVIESYNTVLFFGVAMPINLQGLFQPTSKP